MPYAPQQPYDEGFLRVSEVHNLYYMQCGNPNGKPVVYLHGGPGGDISVDATVYFDPEVYRIVLFTQRGSGKSTPIGDLTDNTTWHLVDDIEKLREHMKIDRWLVFGGSWGSTLALAYSETHPDRCTALCLRGIFLGREVDISWLWHFGASEIWPKEWSEYVAPVPVDMRTNAQDHLKAYQKLLMDPDPKVSLESAKAWSRWETSVSKLRQNPEDLDKVDNNLDWTRSFALIECHYAINKCFMKGGHLIAEENISKIRHLPCTVVQGRYDVVCPVRGAYDLKAAFGEGMKMVYVDDAGHSAKEPGIAKALIEAMDAFRTL